MPESAVGLPPKSALVPVIESPMTADSVEITESTNLTTSQSLFVTGPFQPRDIIFPRDVFAGESFTRSFNVSYYQKYKWIDYSVSENSVYCFPCKQYRKHGDGRSGGVFVDIGFKNWKKSDEKLLKHHCSNEHVKCMSMWISRKIMDAKQTSIAKEISSYHRQSVILNRQYMQKIMKTVLFCAKQDLPLRAHEENRSNLLNESDVNRGNFLELLSFLSKDDNFLKQELEKRAKNTMDRKDDQLWVSPTIQNECITLMGNECIRMMSQEVCNADAFSIIMDETSDMSRTEQVSIVVRYGVEGEMHERFFGFYDVESTTGEQLFNLLKAKLSDWKLSMNKLVGVAFDGASNMSGEHKGLAARVKEVAKYCLYVHCYGHLLNLALQDTISASVSMRNCLGIVQSLYVFLEGSPKRHALLGRMKKEFGENQTTLKDQSDTRWACRYAAVKALLSSISSVIQALLTIQEDRTPKIVTDARCLLISICSFDFVISLLVLEVVLSNTDAFSKYLQAISLDIGAVQSTADSVIRMFQSIRNEEAFDNVWQKAENISELLCKEIEDTNVVFQPAVLKRPKKAPKRFDSDTEAAAFTSPKEYYRCMLFYASVDSIQGEIDRRFEKNTYAVLSSICAIIGLRSKSLWSQEDVDRVAEFYNIDATLLLVEIKLLHGYTFEDWPNTAIKLYKLMNEKDLHNVLPSLYR